MAHFDDPALYKQLGCVYDVAARKAEPKPAYMRDRVHAGDSSAATSRSSATSSSIGTGAGGAVVGRELAEAGLAVVFVEEGHYFDRSHFTGRAFEMQQKLYRRGGSTFSIGNVGDPDPARPDRRRHDDGQLRHVLPHARSRARTSGSTSSGSTSSGPIRWAATSSASRRCSASSARSAELLGGNGRVIARGCDALGFTRHGPLKRNAPACDGQGVCCFGCPTDAKRSTNVSYIPLALRAGAELFPARR